MPAPAMLLQLIRNAMMPQGVPQGAPARGIIQRPQGPGTPPINPLPPGGGVLLPAGQVPTSPGPTPAAQPVQPPPAASTGEALLGATQPSVNPFVGPPEPELGSPSRPFPSIEEQAPTTPEEKQSRLLGWRGFIERFKSDPDLRLAMLQTTLSLTQPAGSAAEGIGRSLGAGVQTLHTLQDRRFAQQQQERQTGIEEREVTVEEDTVRQRAEQFQQTLAQQRKELDARLEQISNDRDYQQGVLRLRQAELNQGGEQGQVNQRWTRVRDAMLADPGPDLAAIQDPEERKARAELLSFDLINKAGQTREKFIADFLASQSFQLLEDDPAAYQEALSRLVLQGQNLADAAGLSSPQAAPSTLPASAQPAAPSVEMAPGQTVAWSTGQTGQVISVSGDTVTIQTQDGQVVTGPRADLEDALARGILSVQ